MTISEQLIDEQNIIVDSDDPKIIISAGPGSGKTYTIIKKAIKELKLLEENSTNKGIVLCSFTREAALELEKRLTRNIHSNFSFIGTIDSFLLTDIINPFKNRILKRIKPNSKLITTKLKISIPPFGKHEVVNILTFQGLTEENINRVKEYYNNWILKLLSGKYEVSFAAYLFAGKALEIVPELKNYIKTRYQSIYVDESQDLNYYQIRFINKLIEFTGINCYLIGDKHQSIYSFRGARPEMFYSMVNHGFVELKITHSARCHYNILEFSRRVVGESTDTQKLYNDSQVIIDFCIAENIAQLINFNNYFILVEKNDDAHSIYNTCLKNGITNIIYSKRIELSDKSFTDNYYDILEELIKFYFNHSNKNPKLTYSIEDLTRFLSPLLDETKLSIRKLSILPHEKLIDYVIKIFKYGDVELSEEIKFEISNQMEDIVYRNYYIRVSNANRIMTIHSSKGLEANCVFVVLTRNSFNISEETKRKLFVAFTRAKNQLFIGFLGSEESRLEQVINQVYQNTFDLTE